MGQRNKSTHVLARLARVDAQVEARLVGEHQHVTSKSNQQQETNKQSETYLYGFVTMRARQTSDQSDGLVEEKDFIFVNWFGVDGKPTHGLRQNRISNTHAGTRGG
jgi:hypothetical protein